MRPRFTAAQIARQERWRREEKYSLATTIISILMLNPFLTAIFPGLFQIAAVIMQWVDVGLKYNRRKILMEEQKALNATKKGMLIKKDSLLTQLSNIDASTKKLKVVKPLNIHAAALIKESRLASDDFAAAKTRHIDTNLVKPTNILLSKLKLDDTPQTFLVHKR